MAGTNEAVARVLERFRGDEALTSPLTDEAAEALLRFAEAAVRSHAGSARDAGDVERYGRLIGDVLTALVADAEAGLITDPAPLLAFLPAPRPELFLALTRLPLSEDTDDNVVSLVRLLTAALPPRGTPTRHRRRRPGR